MQEVSKDIDQQAMVSVIIIFLNAAKYIEEAIESVLAQTYENWELLLVDDGSSDLSTEIAQRYAHQYPGQVHYLEHPDHTNRGMSASRNLGICYAQGDYVAFLDADDIWLPPKLSYQVNILDQQPQAGMIYGNSLYWYSWSGEQKDKQRDYMPPLGVSPNTLFEPPHLLQLYLSGKAAVPCPCSILLRRNTLERIGGFEDAFRGMYEDQAFYAKICLDTSVYVTDTCWDKYRQHAESSVAIALKMRKEQQARAYFLRWLAAYMAEKGVQDRVLWQTLKKERWLVQSPPGIFISRRAQYLIRWVKKWILRVENRVLPSFVSSWLWRK